MTQTTTLPETNITAWQIAKVQEILGNALEKSELSSEPIWWLLEIQSDLLVADLLAALRKRVNTISDMVMRSVTVDYSLNPRQTLDATGRDNSADDDDYDVVASIPRDSNGIKDVNVYFFQLDDYIYVEELEKEFERRGLRVADPYSLAAVNEDDLNFADEHPNATYWKDSRGRWCTITFQHIKNQCKKDYRYWSVNNSVPGLSKGWWVAGLPK